MFKNKLFIIYNLIIVIFIVTSSSLFYMNQTNKDVKTFALRLKPGSDLKKSINDFVLEKGIEAGWIVTAVGSLNDYHIRFANQPTGNKGSGHFEIVSLAGTLSLHGSHIHISASDSTGATIGGHLLDGNIVYTTAEIIIQSDKSLLFTREKDGTTEWPELQIRKKD